MIVKLKWAVIFEFIIILILLAVLIQSYAVDKKIEKQTTTGLLSPRIYVVKGKNSAYITKNNLNVSVYVENLRNGAFMGINEKTG